MYLLLDRISIDILAILPWVLRKVEVLVRLIIVVRNRNCQAYLCVFFVFPSFPLSSRVAKMRKVNEGTRPMLNRHDNGEDGKTKNTQR